MADLTQFLERESETVQAIYAWHEKKHADENQRGYLGGSIIGKECERELWYTFRGCTTPDFSGRMFRLFETGHMEEPRMVEELRGIGCEVHEVGEDGKQFRVASFGDHFAGHLDGVALGIPEAPKTWHLLEFKTHSAKSFRALTKKGVQESKPQHYAQMQVYMGLAKLTRALYLAKNKDTEELHAERIRYDSQAFGLLMDKAKRIIYSPTPAPRISEDPNYYLCRFCDHSGLCHGTADVALPISNRTCKTCCHSTPGEQGGKWHCAKFADWPHIPQETLYKGCEHHLTIPDLLPFAEAVDAGEDWIEFDNTDGGKWKHATRDADGWNTLELMREPGPKACPFKVPTVSLMEKYTPASCNLIAEGKTVEKPSGEITAEQDDEAHHAIEYDRERVWIDYKQHRYQAIWERGIIA